MVSKNPSLAMICAGASNDSPGFFTWPSAMITLLLSVPLNGRAVVAPAAVTPGMARRRLQRALGKCGACLRRRIRRARDVDDGRLDVGRD